MEVRVRPSDGEVRQDAPRPLPADLWRAAHGSADLIDAIHILARRHEEQAHAAADLLERETWALSAILVASAPIWGRLSGATLRFLADQPSETALCFY